MATFKETFQTTGKVLGSLILWSIIVFLPLMLCKVMFLQ